MPRVVGADEAVSMGLFQDGFSFAPPGVDNVDAAPREQRKRRNRAEESRLSYGMGEPSRKRQRSTSMGGADDSDSDSDSDTTQATDGNVVPMVVTVVPAPCVLEKRGTTGSVRLYTGYDPAAEQWYVDARTLLADVFLVPPPLVETLFDNADEMLDRIALATIGPDAGNTIGCTPVHLVEKALSQWRDMFAGDPTQLVEDAQGMDVPPLSHLRDVLLATRGDATKETPTKKRARKYDTKIKTGKKKATKKTPDERFITTGSTVSIELEDGTKVGRIGESDSDGDGDGDSDDEHETAEQEAARIEREDEELERGIKEGKLRRELMTVPEQPQPPPRADEARSDLEKNMADPEVIKAGVANLCQTQAQRKFRAKDNILDAYKDCQPTPRRWRSRNDDTEDQLWNTHGVQWLALRPAVREWLLRGRHSDKLHAADSPVIDWVMRANPKSREPERRRENLAAVATILNEARESRDSVACFKRTDEGTVYFEPLADKTLLCMICTGDLISLDGGGVRGYVFGSHFVYAHTHCAHLVDDAAHVVSPAASDRDACRAAFNLDVEYAYLTAGRARKEVINLGIKFDQVDQVRTEAKAAGIV